MNNFSVNWIINKKLAIGQAPKTLDALVQLRQLKIKSIFSLCGEKEANHPPEMINIFFCKRFVLPDHKCNFVPDIKDIYECVLILESLLKEGPVYIHCVAGKERSPLICIAWLMKNKNLDLIDALEFVRQQHKISNPLSKQLNLLNSEEFKKLLL